MTATNTTKTTRRVPYAYLPVELSRGRVLRGAIEAGWADLLDRGDFTLGRSVEKFEVAFAAAVGTPHAVGLRSGTDALALAIMALGLGHQPHARRCDCELKRIAVPVNTFYASVGAILQAGAWPVLVDVDEEYLIDLRQVTKLWKAGAIDALMPVALTGNPVDIPAGAYEGLPIIHDAAQAIGATIDGRPIGSLGEAVCYSLHPLKNVHAAGDGGVMTTRDPRLAVTVSRLRNHGLISRDDWLTPGFNARLEPVQAVAANAHLPQLEWITKRRNENAALYDELLAGIPKVKIPPRPANKLQAFHTLVYRVPSRPNLVSFLADRGVETKVHYKEPLHLQPALAMLGHKPGDFPVAETQAQEIISLPANQYVTEDDIRYVVGGIREFYGG